MKVRSKYFVISGAIGGLVGFALMEMFMGLTPARGSRFGDIVKMAFYFAGFGLAVGAALGMTEGVVLKRKSRLAYGLVLGLVLGAAGGFVGGGAGQLIFGLLPFKHGVSQKVDVAIALDSSGSMKELFIFGSDPRGERKKAASMLVDRLSDQDRVAIVDFDDSARVLFPLTVLAEQSARTEAKRAISRVDDQGGTNFDAGLNAGIGELEKHRQENRARHLIFLTDGDGYYTRGMAEKARELGIKIHTIGLGGSVNEPLLRHIAYTQNDYHSVRNASDLIDTFEQIYSEQITMVESVSATSTAGTSDGLGFLRYLFRILSWAVMGLAIGFGQGIRENTREDLRACALGGLIGGLIGGALFDPVVHTIHWGGGFIGLGLADIVVAACIGGSMRLAQEKMGLTVAKPNSQLLSFLPKSTGLVDLGGGAPASPAPSVEASAAKGLKGLVIKMKQSVEGDLGLAPPSPAAPKPPPAPEPPPPNKTSRTETKTVVRRKPLSFYQARYQDRQQAMKKAYETGHHMAEDIAEHFGVHPNTVLRTIEKD